MSLTKNLVNLFSEILVESTCEMEMGEGDGAIVQLHYLRMICTYHENYPSPTSTMQK